MNRYTIDEQIGEIMQSWKDTNLITFLTVIVVLLVLVTAYQFYLISQNTNTLDERWTLQLESNWEMQKQVKKLEESLGSHQVDQEEA